MRAPFAALVAGLLLMSATPLASAQDTGFMALGTDIEDDDNERAPAQGVTVPSQLEQTEIDDIVGGSVATVGDEVHFIVDTKESPDDATLIHNQFCWLVAFQVNGGEEEFVALKCQDYEAGEGTWTDEDTNRGTEVASSAEWISGESQVLIKVPFSNIGATRGDVLTDMYVLTYSGGLYVTDVMPDAKSDRDASENLGCYLIGGSGDAARSCDLPATPEGVTKQYENLTGPDATWSQELDDEDAAWSLNLTGFGPNITIEADAEGATGDVGLTLIHLTDDSAGDEARLDAGNTTARLGGRAADGAWRLEVVFEAFSGTLSLTAAAADDGDDADDDGSPVSGGGDGDADNSAGNVTDDGKDSPAGGVMILLATLFAVMAVRRR